MLSALNLPSVAKAAGRPTIDDAVWGRALPVLQAEIGRGKNFAAGKVATALGVSAAAVSQWASGKNRPEMRNLIRAWAFIGRDPAELYGEATDGLALARKLDRIAAQLGITSDRLLTLWNVDVGEGEDSMQGLPDYVRRAAMAVVHIEDCTVGEALQAAWAAWQELQQQPGTMPNGWIVPITLRLKRRSASGLRRLAK